MTTQPNYLRYTHQKTPPPSPHLPRQQPQRMRKPVLLPAAAGERAERFTDQLRQTPSRSANFVFAVLRGLTREYKLVFDGYVALEGADGAEEFASRVAYEEVKGRLLAFERGVVGGRVE